MAVQKIKVPWYSWGAEARANRKTNALNAQPAVEIAKTTALEKRLAEEKKREELEAQRPKNTEEKHRAKLEELEREKELALSQQELDEITGVEPSNSSKTNNSDRSSIWDNKWLKYTGITALVGVPITGLVGWLFGNKKSAGPIPQANNDPRLQQEDTVPA